MSDYKNNKDQDFYKKNGVDYTPSFEMDNVEEEKPVRKRPSQPKRGPKKETGQSHYRIFMGLTIGVGAIVCIAVFFIFYNLLGGGISSRNSGATDPELEDNEFVNISATSDINALLTQMSSGGEITAIDIASGQSFSITVTNTTALRNKYGSSTTLADFKKGDIVQIDLSEDRREATLLKHSSEAWELLGVSNVVVDPIAKTVQVGNQSFVYPDYVMTSSKGEAFDIAAVKESDVVSMKGYKNELLTISLDKSNGTIKVANYDHIQDGIIEIGNILYKNLSEEDTFEVAEGIHRVVIKGANIESYIQDVKVEASQIAEVDLSGVQPKTAVLTIAVNEEDYTLYIDDVIVDDKAAPVVLAYDSYDIKVQKAGFSEWSRKVDVSEPTVRLNITLTEQVQMGKLTISSEPSGAQVYIDNAYIGTSPVEESVTYGEHRILIKKEGYADMPVVINVDKSFDSYFITLPQLTTSTETETVTQEPTVDTEWNAE